MKRDSIIDFLGFITVKLLIALLYCVPLRLALWIGRSFGDFAYLVNSKRRSIAYANLKSAFPGKASGDIKKINRAHFENLGMNIIELLKLPLMGRKYLDRHVRIENADRIKEAMGKGKGIILLSAHFGNWEISSLAASAQGYRLSIFVREQKYIRLNNLLNKYRQMTGSKVVAKGFSVREIIRTLHNNGIVAMLTDQDAGAKGVFVDFLGRPASTAQGAVNFSLKTGAAILPSFTRRTDYDKHVLEIGEPLKLFDTGNKEEDLKTNLQKISDILECFIKRSPELWLWSHKRWKSTPQRTVLVLSDGKAGHFNQAMAVAEMVEEASLDFARGRQGSRLRQCFGGQARLPSTSLGAGNARGIEKRPMVKIHAAEIRFKNNITRMFLDIASLFAGRRCQGCGRCLRFCLTRDSFHEIENRYADIIISCGASTVAANIYLSYENNAKGIAVMKPGMGRSRKFDLVILPRHDVPFDISTKRLFSKRHCEPRHRRRRDEAISFLRLLRSLRSLAMTIVGQPPNERGKSEGMRPNIVVTETAPNRITEDVIRQAASRWTMDGGGRARNGLGLLIGGDARDYKLKKETVEKVINGILRIADEMDCDVYVSTSRRTSKEIDLFLKDRLSGNKRCRLLVIANERNIDGVVPMIFGLSDVLLVSPDSISMVSEAASSGKYVVVFRLEAEGSRLKGKYDRAVDNLERKGYIKTSPPDEIYDVIKGLFEKRPCVKRIHDREKIIEKLKGII